MGNKEQYVVTGRYMRGKEATGYHIMTSKNDKQKRVTREQFIYMLGQGSIINCTGQVYGEQVIIRGTNGVNISELPIYDDNSGKIRNLEYITQVKPTGGDMEQVLSQVTLVGRLMCGRENIGFEVRNHGGRIIRLPRQQVIQLAENKLITNAVVQNLNKDGVRTKVIRGVGIELRDLPRIKVNAQGNITR